VTDDGGESDITEVSGTSVELGQKVDNENTEFKGYMEQGGVEEGTYKTQQQKLGMSACWMTIHDLGCTDGKLAAELG